MRVILPISLLLSAVVTPTVSRSVPPLPLSSLSLRSGTFVILCRDTCVHMQAYVYSRYSFFSFYLLIASHHPLVNMIFLNSYSRLSALLYTAISLIPSSFIPSFASHLALVLPLSLQSHSFLLFPSLLCQSSSHSSVFIFYSSLWRAPFSPFLFYRFIAPRLRAPFSIIISSLAFSTLYLLTRSSLYLLNSLNLLDTHRNSRAEMDFHSLRVILAYDGLRT